MSSIDLTHHFLIAMPNMADPYFEIGRASCRERV